MHPQAIIHDVDQGSDEWHAARNGILTASEMNLCLTASEATQCGAKVKGGGECSRSCEDGFKTCKQHRSQEDSAKSHEAKIRVKSISDDKTRKHVYELAAQRISNYTEPTFIGDAMLRGHVDEVKARDAYSEHYDPVEEMGFITRDVGGVVLGYSPDGAGVMGGFGIECKSRVQKYQVETITSNAVPTEHIMQLQTGLLVTGWEYIDYLSYSGGLPMWRIRCEPIAEYQEAILSAALEFEAKVQEVVDAYQDRLASCDVVIETEREEPETEVYFDEG